MDYYKVKITITPYEEWLSDILASQLAEAGFESFLQNTTGLEAFIKTDEYKEKNILNVIKLFEGNHKFIIETEKIKNKNWNEVWEKNYFKPLVINNECVIHAPFHTDYPKLQYEIIIEPNMAFGTGYHETTLMMLETILQHDFTDKRILDMGCGTGILGILASMKGAKKITAIDIDEWAVNGTLGNINLNNIKNITVIEGDASILKEEKYDFIFANIHKNVLMNDLSIYEQHLNKSGKLFISGFYKEDIPELKGKAETLGLQNTGYITKNNWVTCFFKK